MLLQTLSPVLLRPGAMVSEVSEVTDISEKISSLSSPFPASAGGINFSELAAEQLSCPNVLRLQNSKTLKLVTVMVQCKPLICDSKTKVLRPLVLSTYRFKIFSALHCLSHPGIRATRRIISSRFVRRGLANDVQDYCHSCLPCQRGKVLQHVHLRPEKIEVPFRRFSHVHVDLVGPLPSSHGYTYLLTCLDRSTWWPEVIPLTGIPTAECVFALFHGWILPFGVPSIITSDRNTVHLFTVV